MEITYQVKPPFRPVGKLMVILICIAQVQMCSPAYAGWWSDFCNRHLIADDPYQWEQYDNYFLLREQDRLKVKIEWQTATDNGIRRFEHISAELHRRTNDLGN